MQASTLFDPFTFTGVVHAIKKAAAPSEGKPAEKAAGGAKGGKGASQARKGGKRKAARDEDDDDDDEVFDEEEGAGPSRGGTAAGGSVDPSQLCTEALGNLQLFFQTFALRGYGDMLGMLVESCVEITRTAQLGTSGKSGRGRGKAAGPSKWHACALIVNYAWAHVWRFEGAAWHDIYCGVLMAACMASISYPQAQLGATTASCCEQNPNSIHRPSHGTMCCQHLTQATLQRPPM